MATRVNITEERIELTTIDRGAEATVRRNQAAWDGLKTSVDAVKNVLAAAGITIGAGAMAKLYLDTVRATSAMGNLAQQTGATVENLSRLQNVAKIGGHDFASVGDALGGMIRNLKGVGDEGKGATHALEFLGVKAKDSNGRFRDTVEILNDVAVKLAKYEDGGNKVALVQDLLGKSGAKWLPLLKDIAEEGLKNAGVTAKMQAEAEAFEKNLNRLLKTGDSLVRTLVSDTVPALDAVARSMLRAREAGEGFFTMMIRGWQTLVTGDDLHKARQELVGLTNDILALQNTRDRLGSSLGAKYNPYTRGRMASLDAQIAGKMERAGEVQRYIGELEGQRAPKAGEPAKPLGYQTPGTSGGAAAGKISDDFSPMSRSVGDRVAMLSEELNATSALTEAEKLRYQLMRDIENGYKTLTPYEVASVRAKLDELEALERQKRAKDAWLKVEKEIEQARAQALAEQERSIKSGEEEIRTMRERVSEIGLTTEQIAALRIARMDDAIATKEREIVLERAQMADEAYVKSLEKQVEQLRILRDLKGEEGRRTVAAETKKRAEEEAQKQRDGVARIIEDGLMRGFERGSKSGAQVLKETLVNAFKTLVLTPIIRPIAQAGAGLVLGGLGSVANAAGLGNLVGGGGFGGGMGGGGVFNFNPILNGAQTFADFGNFFGSIGSITEAGGTFGLMDAIGGFAAANPLAALGIAVGGAALISSLFGDDKGDDPRGIPFRSPFGRVIDPATAADYGDMHYAFLPGHRNYRAPGVKFVDFAEGVAASERNLISNLGLNASQVSAVDARFAANNRRYSFGLVGKGFSEQDTQRIAADRLRIISEVLGRSIEDLAVVMSLSAEQFKSAVAALEQQRAQVGGTLRGYADRLGITSLTEFQRGLSVSEINAPLDRIAAARGQFESALGLARGGDLEAARSVAGLGGQLLDIGRNVYASGAGFQDLRQYVEASVASLLGGQQSILADLTRDVPASVMQAGRDTVTEIKKQTTALLEGLAKIETELRRLGQAA